MRNIIRNGVIIFTVIVLALSMVQAAAASHTTNQYGRYDDQNPEYHSATKTVYDNNVRYYKQYHSPSRNYGYDNAYRRGYDNGYYDGYYTGRYVERKYQESSSSRYTYRSSYNYRPSSSYLPGYTYHRTTYPVGYHRTVIHYSSY